MLKLPCHHGCRNVLGGMVVTDKVSCSEMININFHGHGMYLPVLIIVFFTLPYCVILVRKPLRVCLTCVLAFLTKPSLGSQVYKGRYNVQQASRVNPVTTGIQKHCE